MSWIETEKKMASNASKFPSLIGLNVGMFPNNKQINKFHSFQHEGGKKFIMTKESLLKHKGSYFESILRTDNSQQVNGKYVLIPPSSLFFILTLLFNLSESSLIEADIYLSLFSNF
jgi:hypothetical protein